MSLLVFFVGVRFEVVDFPFFGCVLVSFYFMCLCWHSSYAPHAPPRAPRQPPRSLFIEFGGSQFFVFLGLVFEFGCVFFGCAEFSFFFLFSLVFVVFFPLLVQLFDPCIHWTRRRLVLEASCRSALCSH